VPQITSVLIGASSVAQLEANLATLRQPPLSTAELGEITPRWRASPTCLPARRPGACARLLR